VFATSIAELEAGGSTALFDATFLALQSADPERGRPIILIFSDGGRPLQLAEAGRRGQNRP
jgi:hypothetical protein